MDWYAFTLAFKSVFLEGFEVAFIVLTFGTAQENIPLAALGALLALGVVVLVGALLREPLSRVPENTIKFAVGLLLSTFGLFWSVEGLAAEPIAIDGGPDHVDQAPMEFFGPLTLVNGRIWPRTTVQADVYRLRILNGANARTFRLRFTDADGNQERDGGTDRQR
ncbi:MAG: hypothetical protein ACJ8CR_39290 [Roseiflexaceae bacterium]